MCDFSLPFPLYDKLLQEATTNPVSDKELRDTCESLPLVYDKLDAGWSKYVSTIADLVIKKYFHAKGTTGVMRVESSSSISYSIESLDPTLTQMVCKLINMCIETDS